MPELLEPVKDEPYQCTHGCGKHFKLKDSWHRHEETWFPQREWLCLVHHVEFKTGSRICKYCRKPDADAKHIRLLHLGELLKVGNTNICCQIIRGRKDKVKQHYNAVHDKSGPSNEFPWNTFVDACEYDVPYDSGWACRFCTENPVFSDWHAWLKHVGDHFLKGSSMKDWQEYHSESEELAEVQDDNTNCSSACEEDHGSHENGSEGAGSKSSSNDQTDSFDEDEDMSSGGSEDTVPMTNYIGRNITVSSIKNRNLRSTPDVAQQVRSRPSLGRHPNAPGGR